MKLVTKSALIGSCLSLAFGITALAMVRFWSGLPFLFFAPATFAEHAHLDAVPLLIARLLVPQGGAPGVLLLYAGTSFAVWFVLFSVASFIVLSRRRNVV